MRDQSRKLSLSQIPPLYLILLFLSYIQLIMNCRCADFMKNIIHFIHVMSEWSGYLIAWLVLIMALIIVYDVSMRGLFSIGSVALQELQWHLFALIFLLGAGYTLKQDDHVRVDIIYQSHWMTPRRQAWVNLLGGIFFLIPFCLLIISSSLPFVYDSYLHQEGSPDPGGLPYRFLIKAAMPIGFSLLLLQGIADILKNLLNLLRINRE